MLCQFDGMTEIYPATVFAYHGCERSVAEKILASSSEELKESNRRGDWLGRGAYLWENAPCRAYEWAARNEKVKEPYVLGAVVRLGKCLNLMDKNCVRELQNARNRLIVPSCDRLTLDKFEEGLWRGSGSGIRRL